MRKLKGSNEAITYRRGLVHRLPYLAAVCMLSMLMFAPSALAQSETESEGGGPGGPYGLYTCADFADRLQAQEAYLQGEAAQRSVLDPNGDGIACRDSDALSEGGTGSEGGGPSGPYGLYICADFADRMQAQEAYLQGGIGSNPAADRDILDPDGDGIACEELPTADGETPTGETPTGETSTGETSTGETSTGETSTGETSVGDGSESEKTKRERRERRERSGREGTDGEVTGPNGEVTGPNGEVTGPNGEVTSPDGEVTSPDGEVTGTNGGSGGGGSANGEGNSQGGGGGAASQGGVSGAVADAVSPVTRGRLPATGGGWTVLALLAGIVLIVGGLLVRRFAR